MEGSKSTFQLPIINFRLVAFNAEVTRDIVKQCEQNIIKNYDGSITKYPASDFTPPVGGFIIAETNQGVVACGGFRKLNKKVAELKRIFVVPEYRRQGIAKNLVSRLEQQAQQFGYKEVWLETAKKPKASTEFYKNLGYREIPSFGEYVELDGSQCFAKTL